MLETLTVVTALFGGPSLFRAAFGLGRGAPSPGDDEHRLELAFRGGSLVAIALLVAAPLGVFGAWAGAFALCAGLALIRPRWMVPGGNHDPRQGAAAYGALCLLLLVFWLIMPGSVHPGAGHGRGDYDLLALGTLLGGRAWLWFKRNGAPFSKKSKRGARLDRDDDPAILGGGTRNQAWWDRAWARRTAHEDASFADATGPDPDPEPWRPPNPKPAPKPAPAPDPATNPAANPAAADAALKVPGYDSDLLTEELATFRAHGRLIDRVAMTWPSHPVSEALIHVSVILNETRRFLQDNPDKYRDLRPILVHHAATAADIARLVDRIKGVGEALDDAEGVAHRLFALASLMRETRRKSTQAERDRLKASMAVIDDELSALSAVQNLRSRMADEARSAD